MTELVHTEQTATLFQIFYNATILWKSVRNSCEKDEDLDMSSEREQINSIIDSTYHTLSKSVSARTLEKSKADSLFNDVQQLQTKIFRYQESTITRATLNLQNKLALSFEAYKTNWVVQERKKTMYKSIHKVLYFLLKHTWNKNKKLNTFLYEILLLFTQRDI